MNRPFSVGKHPRVPRYFREGSPWFQGTIPGYPPIMSALLFGSKRLTSDMAKRMRLSWRFFVLVNDGRSLSLCMDTFVRGGSAVFAATHPPAQAFVRQIMACFVYIYHKGCVIPLSSPMQSHACGQSFRTRHPTSKSTPYPDVLQHEQ